MTTNRLIGDFTEVRSSKGRWTVKLRNGVLFLDGQECLVKEAEGILDFCQPPLRVGRDDPREDESHQELSSSKLR